MFASVPIFLMSVTCERAGRTRKRKAAWRRRSRQWLSSHEVPAPGPGSGLNARLPALWPQRIAGSGLPRRGRESAPPNAHSNSQAPQPRATRALTCTLNGAEAPESMRWMVPGTTPRAMAPRVSDFGVAALALLFRRRAAALGAPTGRAIVDFAAAVCSAKPAATAPRRASPAKHWCTGMPRRPSAKGGLSGAAGIVPPWLKPGVCGRRSEAPQPRGGPAHTTDVPLEPGRRVRLGLGTARPADRRRAKSLHHPASNSCVAEPAALPTTRRRARGRPHCPFSSSQAPWPPLPRLRLPFRRRTPCWSPLRFPSWRLR